MNSFCLHIIFLLFALSSLAQNQIPLHMWEWAEGEGYLPVTDAQGIPRYNADLRYLNGELLLGIDTVAVVSDLRWRDGFGGIEYDSTVIITKDEVYMTTSDPKENRFGFLSDGSFVIGQTDPRNSLGNSSYASTLFFDKPNYSIIGGAHVNTGNYNTGGQYSFTWGRQLLNRGVYNFIMGSGNSLSGTSYRNMIMAEISNLAADSYHNLLIGRLFQLSNAQTRARNNIFIGDGFTKSAGNVNFQYNLMRTGGQVSYSGDGIFSGNNLITSFQKFGGDNYDNLGVLQGDFYNNGNPNIDVQFEGMRRSIIMASTNWQHGIRNSWNGVFLGDRLNIDGAHRSFVMGDNVENTGQQTLIFNGITSGASNEVTDPFFISNSIPKKGIFALENGLEIWTQGDGFGGQLNGFKFHGNNKLQLLDYIDDNHLNNQPAYIAAFDDEGNVVMVDSSLVFSGSSSGTGEANTISNIGNGDSLFHRKNGADFELKTLVFGSNLNTSTTDSTIHIDAVIGFNDHIQDVQLNGTSLDFTNDSGTSTAFGGEVDLSSLSYTTLTLPYDHYNRTVDTSEVRFGDPLPVGDWEIIGVRYSVQPNPPDFTVTIDNYTATEATFDSSTSMIEVDLSNNPVDLSAADLIKLEVTYSGTPPFFPNQLFAAITLREK